MSNIAAYIRVSSKGQKLDSQRREVQRYLDSQGFHDVQWFDDRSTGANTDRPLLLNSKCTTGWTKRWSRTLRTGDRASYTWMMKGTATVRHASLFSNRHPINVY